MPNEVKRQPKDGHEVVTKTKHPAASWVDNIVNTGAVLYETVNGTNSG